MHREFIQSLVTDAMGNAARIVACEQLKSEAGKNWFRAGEKASQA